MTRLPSKEIERKRILVSKFKEDAINHIEIQELVNILEKEKHIAEEEEEEGGNGMLVFAISSLISHLSEYLTSQSGIKEEQLLDNNNLVKEWEHIQIYNITAVYFGMLRGLSFSFPVYVGIMFCLAISVVDLDNKPFSLEYTEEQQEQLIHFMSSSLDDSGGHDLYHGSAFIKELEKLIKNFEYTFDLEGNQIFPTNNIKQDIISEYKSSEYNIDDLNYELLGFKIRASDIRIYVDPKKIDDTETRVDIPLLLAKDIKVSNGGLVNLSYDAVDLGSVYGIYNKATDKMTVHVPLSIAAKYVKQ